MGLTNDFKTGELLDAICANPDKAFPELHFQKANGAKWVLVSHYHLNGKYAKDNSKQTYVTTAGTIKDFNGDEKSMIDYYGEKHHITNYADALAALAAEYGLTPPSSPEYKERKEEQERRESAVKAFQQALFSNDPEANEVLSYIRERGWSDEEIIQANLGYANTSLVEGYIPLDERCYTDKKTGESRAMAAYGSTHRLVIPFFSATKIYGFKFRDIHWMKDESKLPKYLNTKFVPKRSNLFGLNAVGKDCVVVEGELDALHAMVKGVNNIVATTGGKVSEEAIKDAMRRSFIRFTLLFDNDDRGHGFVKDSISVIEQLGGEAWIAVLPETSEAKDIDEFLKDHSIEELQTVIKEAMPSYLWKFDELVQKYSAIEEGQGKLTDKDREDFYADFESLLNAPSMKPENRERLKERFKDYSYSLQINLSDCEAYLDKAYYRKQAKNQTEKIRTAGNRIQELINSGQMDAAVKLMSSTATSIRTTDKSTEFAKSFAPIEDFDRFLGEIPEGIPTGYKIGTEKILLNPGLTFICAPTSHGKTSFLNNLVLNELKRNLDLQNGKSVLYFSYEVDSRRLLVDLLNTYVNDKDLSKVNKPLNAIKDYFKSKSNRYFKAERRTDGRYHYDYFLAKKQEFQRRYIATNSLCIVEESYMIDELLEAINYYLIDRTPSAIFIDYAQLIYSETDGNKTRTEEIKRIVNKIKNLANSKGIPFVMAAQFKNDVISPLDVTIYNIGESKDLGMIADTAIGLFNLARLQPVLNTQASAAELKKLLSRLTGTDIKSIEPIANKIYAKFLKNRNGESEKEGLFDWEGRTKYITPNDPDSLNTNSASQQFFNFEDKEPEDCPF